MTSMLFPLGFLETFSQKTYARQNLHFIPEAIRDRSFFMREGELVGFGGGALEKNWLERGGQPKKNEGKGGVGRKN